MLYQRYIRPTLLLLPAIILCVALGYTGLSAWKNDQDGVSAGIKGVVLFSPASSIISWSIVHELDASRQLQAYLNQRNQQKQRRRDTV